MNPVAMTIINTRKEYWPSRGSNQPPPVRKSSTLPTDLWARCFVFNDAEKMKKWALSKHYGKRRNAENQHFATGLRHAPEKKDCILHLRDAAYQRRLHLAKGGSVPWKDPSEPQSSASETQEKYEYISCRLDKADIMLKAA